MSDALILAEEPVRLSCTVVSFSPFSCEVAFPLLGYCFASEEHQHININA
jgi:hypothetical protein